MLKKKIRTVAVISRKPLVGCIQGWRMILSSFRVKTPSELYMCGR